MLFNLFLIVCALAVLTVLATLAARCLGVRKLRLGRLHLALEKPMDLGGEHFSAGDGMAALAWGLGALCLTYGVSLLYCGIFGKGVSWNNFCDAWQQYDAVHYLRLAERGYAGYMENGQHYFLVFFPLYPWLMRLLHLIIPNYALCGHLISSLCYLGSCYMLARLVTEEFGHRIAQMSLFFLCAFPFAFFFASIHTESLFLLLSLLSFYFIRKHRYPLAGLFGALAALTRMQGLLLALVAFVEYCMTERPIRKIREKQWRALWRDLWGKLFWMAFMAVGTGIYLLLNKVVDGDPFAFLGHQAARWNQGTQLFTKSLTGLWGALWNSMEGYEFVPYTTWGPELVLFVFCLAALLYGLRRIPPLWTLYFTICVLLNFSLKNPLSCGRYMACAFPLPVLLAVAGRRRPLAGKFVMLAYGVFQGLFMLAYFAGKHVC